MDQSKILLGIAYVFVAQVGTFIQVQMSYKMGWYEKYQWLVLLVSIPLCWLYIKSVHFFIQGFNGQLWPSRLIGFGVGVLVFTIMSITIFREPLSLKNLLCIGLGFLIILIQIFLK